MKNTQNNNNRPSNFDLRAYSSVIEITLSYQDLKDTKALLERLEAITQLPNTALSLNFSNLPHEPTANEQLNWDITTFIKALPNTVKPWIVACDFSTLPLNTHAISRLSVDGNLNNLKYINLSNIDTLTDDRLFFFLEAHPNLEHLDIHGCTKITDATVRNLAHHNKSLTTLNTSQTRITAKALLNAFTEGSFTSLKSLRAENTFTSSDLAKIYKNSQGKDLRKLEGYKGQPMMELIADIIVQECINSVQKKYKWQEGAEHLTNKTISDFVQKALNLAFIETTQLAPHHILENTKTLKSLVEFTKNHIFEIKKTSLLSKPRVCFIPSDNFAPENHEFSEAFSKAFGAPLKALEKQIHADRTTKKSEHHFQQLLPLAPEKPAESPQIDPSALFEPVLENENENENGSNKEDDIAFEPVLDPTPPQESEIDVAFAQTTFSIKKVDNTHLAKEDPASEPLVSANTSSRENETDAPEQNLAESGPIPLFTPTRITTREENGMGTIVANTVLASFKNLTSAVSSYTPSLSTQPSSSQQQRRFKSPTPPEEPDLNASLSNATAASLVARGVKPQGRSLMVYLPTWGQESIGTPSSDHTPSC